MPCFWSHAGIYSICIQTEMPLLLAVTNSEMPPFTAMLLRTVCLCKVRCCYLQYLQHVKTQQCCSLQYLQPFISSINPLQTHYASILFANGCNRQPPTFFVSRVPSESFPNPSFEHFVCKWGGGAFLGRASMHQSI